MRVSTSTLTDRARRSRAGLSTASLNANRHFVAFLARLLFLVLATVLVVALPVPGFGQKSSHIGLHLGTELGGELKDARVEVFREYRNTLESVDFSSESLQYYDGGTRYHARVSGAGTYMKERTFVVAGPDTQLWIVPEGGKTREVKAPSAQLSGVINKRREESNDQLWLKLLSVPEFEEIGDFLLSEDGHFEFGGLDSGIYLLVVVSRPERTTLPRILASQEVVVCESNAQEHVVVELTEPVSMRTQCETRRSKSEK